MKKPLVTALAIIGTLSLGALYFQNLNRPQLTQQTAEDSALLAIIKNDRRAFETYVAGGGDLHASLPMIDDKALTVIEGVVQFERLGFIEHLQSQKRPFLRQELTKDYDLLTLAVAKNNADLFKVLLKEGPKLDRLYGKRGWGLLHLASAECSSKIVGLLQEKGLRWDLRAKDGTTALTIAAEKECLPVLSFFKEQGADFRATDGRGVTALSILRTKKDAAILAFAGTFEPVRKIASASVVSAPTEVNFYKKRKTSREDLLNKAALLEPELRPDDAYETAENSEFAD